jgi:hypothetical protein
MLNQTDTTPVNPPDLVFPSPPRGGLVPQTSPEMIKTFSLSVLFFLTLGLMFAAYASVPAGL